MADLIDRDVVIGRCQEAVDTYRKTAESMAKYEDISGMARACAETAALLLSDFRALPAAPDPRDEVIRGLVEAVERSRQYITGSMADRSGPLLRQLDAALAAARKLGVE